MIRFNDNVGCDCCDQTHIDYISVVPMYLGKGESVLVWDSSRIRRLSIWAGVARSPSLELLGIKPTFGQAWTGIL